MTSGVSPRNGHGCYETPDENGYVQDDDRIEMMQGYIDYMLKAKKGLQCAGLLCMVYHGFVQLGQWLRKALRLCACGL